MGGEQGWIDGVGEKFKGSDAGSEELAREGMWCACVRVREECGQSVRKSERSCLK